MERCLQRLYLGRGSPRDLAAIGQTLSLIAEIKKILSSTKAQPELLKLYTKNLATHENLVSTLAKAIVEEPPPTTIEGGFINDKYALFLSI
jgi:DNA mismatch repair protein MutS